MQKHKLIVIVGPTATGKSDLAVRLARKFNGEIVSADSRQVYKGMDIGTGKITKKEMRGVPHHLLDVAHPGRTFTVAHFQKRARAALRGIWKRHKIPILVGGTGFYIQAVVDGLVLPDVKPNTLLRKKLERRTTQDLFALLERNDSERAATIDRHNRRRLIRALEIVEAYGHVPKLKGTPLPADVLIIGIKKDMGVLKDHIRARLLQRMRRGLVREVERLHEDVGLSWQKLDSLGLEYRHVAHFLQGKHSKSELIKILVQDIYAYAKRQMTWFKRDARIVWLEDAPTAFTLARAFLPK